jgi:Arginine repressor, DNA binding domain
MIMQRDEYSRTPPIDDSMGVQKRFRQGQILKLVSGQAVGSQDELRRRLGHLGVRVTQATLSRDMRFRLRLPKNPRPYLHWRGR